MFPFINYRKIVFMPALVLTLLLPVSGCASEKVPEKSVINTVSPTPAITDVKAAEAIVAEKKPIRKVITTEGHFGYSDPINLYFKTGNLKVTKIYAKLGDQVKKGDLLAELDSSDLKVELDTWTLKLEKAKLNYNRLKLLEELEGGHRFDLLIAEQEAGMCEKKANYFKEIIAECRLTAPTAGTVTDVVMKEGDFVPAYFKVIELVDPIDLKFVCSLSVGDNVDYKSNWIKDPSGLSAGMKGTISVKQNEKEEKVGCTLESIDFPVIYDGQTGMPLNSSQQFTLINLTFSLEGEVPEMVADKTIGKVRLDTGIVLNQIALPDEAVTANKILEETTVKVLKGNRQEERKVKVGFYNGEDKLVEIREGLSEGELILVK